MSTVKLYMVLLGCKHEGRHIEQHDVFFGIASSLKGLVAQMERFWPDSGKLHIDAWREVNIVEGFRIEVQDRLAFNASPEQQSSRLFFINLGGYQPEKFEEQHYMLLTAKVNRASAIAEAKQTLFFQNNHFKGASSHVDDKYGIDVDDIYDIEEILAPGQKEQFRIVLLPQENQTADPIHLGYLKLSSLK